MTKPIRHALIRALTAVLAVLERRKRRTALARAIATGAAT